MKCASGLAAPPVRIFLLRPALMAKELSVHLLRNAQHGCLPADFATFQTRRNRASPT